MKARPIGWAFSFWKSGECVLYEIEFPCIIPRILWRLKTPVIPKCAYPGFSEGPRTFESAFLSDES